MGMGAMNWGSLATLFGGHVRLVFTLVLGIFIVCVATTLTSYAEIPLDVLANSPNFPGKSRRRSSVYNKFVPDENLADTSGSAEMEKLDGKQDYGSFDRVVSFEEKPQHVQGNPFVKATVAPSTSPLPNNGNQYEEKYLQVAETTFSQASPLPVEEGQIAAGATKATLINYLWTILYMPYSLRILCMTSVFNLVAGGWRCIPYHVPYIPLLLKNLSKGSEPSQCTLEASLFILLA